ncbi:MAG: RluA family pseudouridine synthase [Clostridia bacterium]|nr:RluA family pseudouridine synthase [Clostridia bacterium]
MNLKYVIDESSTGKKMKHVLKYNLGLSERLIKKLKYDNKITCNNIPVFVNHTVSAGDVIEVFIEFVEESEDVIPENIPIDILYEDDSIIAINKQPNIVVHPTSSHLSGTIANAVMYHLQQKGLHLKIRPVSRLDRDTSGIILFAKNQFIQESLIRQMSDKTFYKEYIGVVTGIMKNQAGTIDLPIERKPGSIMLRQTSPSGSPSVTHYEVLEFLDDATYLKFHLETGRTHQIRVHCQAIRHPLVGDTLYSDIPSPYINRQALHSQRVSFIHPILKKQFELYAPLPKDISTLLEILKK